MQNSLMQCIQHPCSSVGVMEAHLPSLRRHAEAMSGSRESAAAYMAAMTDILAMDSPALPVASSAKVGLFKLYTRLYAYLVSQGQPAHARARQIMLLVLIEGFSKRETAEILDVSLAEMVTILKSAGVLISERDGAGAIGNRGKGRQGYSSIRTSQFKAAC